jgi:anti-sigma regulatory factor (Ser/Thr protein kinase)
MSQASADGIAMSLQHGGPGLPGPWRPAHEQPDDGLRDAFFHLALPNGISAPRIARLGTRKILSEWRAGDDATEKSALIVSELVTNAARFSAGQITLTIWGLPGILVIKVSDQAGELPELRDPDIDSEGGRGLLLVAALSREWGHYLSRPGWKTVYAVIDTP